MRFAVVPSRPSSTPCIDGLFDLFRTAFRCNSLQQTGDERENTFERGASPVDPVRNSASVLVMPTRRR